VPPALPRAERRAGPLPPATAARSPPNPAAPPRRRPLLQELGGFLGAREWAAARLVCRHWRRHVTAGVDLLELDLERSPHRWAMVTGSVRRLFPRLRAVTLLVGTRVGPGEFSDRMAELSFAIDLPELELRYVPASAPRLGAVLADVRGVAELPLLRVLKLSGGPTPSVECVEVRLRVCVCVRACALRVWGLGACVWGGVRVCACRVAVAIALARVPVARRARPAVRRRGRAWPGDPGAARGGGRRGKQGRRRPR
jgi:hypothetical protein